MVAKGEYDLMANRSDRRLLTLLVSGPISMRPVE